MEDPKVYLLLAGKKYWFTTEAAFARLGYAMGWVEDVDNRLLAALPNGADLGETSMHPEGALVKYAGDAKVYRVEGQKKRHIANESVFNRLGYRFDRVVMTTLSYTDGEAITQ